MIHALHRDMYSTFARSLMYVCCRCEHCAGANYFEVDMDISSSSTASRILTLVRSLSTSLIVDVGLTIEVNSFAVTYEKNIIMNMLFTGNGRR